MYKRLINHIEKNNILTQHQYGFRENRSTELAIIELVDRVTKAIDRGEYTIGIFLGILRNPDRTRTRTRRKSGLEKNPDPDSKKIRTRA